jgi:hypothetical protein
VGVSFGLSPGRVRRSDGVPWISGDSRGCPSLAQLRWLGADARSLVELIGHVVVAQLA